jgi:hypothetical protein
LEAFKDEDDKTSLHEARWAAALLGSFSTEAIEGPLELEISLEVLLVKGMGSTKGLGWLELRILSSFLREGLRSFELEVKDASALSLIPTSVGFEDLTFCDLQGGEVAAFLDGFAKSTKTFSKSDTFKSDFDRIRV